MIIINRCSSAALLMGLLFAACNGASQAASIQSDLDNDPRLKQAGIEAKVSEWKDGFVTIVLTKHHFGPKARAAIASGQGLRDIYMGTTVDVAPLMQSEEVLRKRPEVKAVIWKLDAATSIDDGGSIDDNEAAAIGSLRAISSAQSTFAASCANGFYAQNLTVLGTASVGKPAFISSDLSSSQSVVKSGYRISMTGTSSSGSAACNGATALALGYRAWAEPVSPSTGRRHFFTNATGTIWQSDISMKTDAASDSAAPLGGRAIY